MRKGTLAVKQTPAIARRIPDQSTASEFGGLWDGAHLIRSFLWSQETTDEEALLTLFLARVRRLFNVDFCCGTILFGSDKPVEVGLPEASLAQLPANFALRCLDLIAASRIPVTRRHPYGTFGFRSAVFVPLTPIMAQPLGFLMLGHSTSRIFSPSELVLLQSLAGELSWAVRDISSKKSYHRLLSTISHEINNPLNLVLEYSRLLRKRLSALLSDEHQRHFQGLEDGAADVLNLLNGLIDGAVAHEGKAAVAEGAMELASVLEEVLLPFREQAKEKDIELEVQYGSHLPAQIITDALKFKQIVRNLVDNAVKFTARGRVQLNVEVKAGLLEISVSDTGIGIEDSLLRKIFEPTDQVDSALNPARQGVGIGLSVVKALSEFLKGHLHVRSRPGEGSQFTVCLPCE